MALADSVLGLSPNLSIASRKDKAVPVWILPAVADGGPFCSSVERLNMSLE